MRYKELTLRKIQQLEFLVTGLDSELSKATTKERLSEYVVRIKEKIEDLESTVSLENEETGRP